MRIGIVGGGVVGRATAAVYSPFHEVRVYDTNPLRSTHLLHEVDACELTLICLPTPQKKDGMGCDTSVLDQYFENHCLRMVNESNLVIKSTVPIGYTKRISQLYRLPNLVHSPEFLTARTARIDAMTPAINIIGSPHERGSYALGKRLAELYRERFPGVPVLCMTSDESEAVKLIVNSFFAVKIAFFNEMRSLCDALHLDWETVLAGVLSDGRIAHSHTMVPGPDGQRGFGGSCLPKDLANLIDCMTQAKVDYAVTSGARMRNEVDRRVP